MKLRAGSLAIAFVVATASLTKCEGSDENQGWTSIFNGKNLDGWVIKCLPKDNDKRGCWKAVDGTITAEPPCPSVARRLKIPRRAALQNQQVLGPGKPVERAIILMADGLILFWIVIGGSLTPF